MSVTTEFGPTVGSIAAALCAVVSTLAWQCWGVVLRSTRRSTSNETDEGMASLHDRIDYVLTEARVMLPGAQALLGFQLLVPLMKSFETLPDAVRVVHFIALLLVALTVVLLISPAAIHRITFGGDDDERFLDLASRIVTAALIPFSLGVASELYVATFRLLPDSTGAAWIAGGGACVLLGLWCA